MRRIEVFSSVILFLIAFGFIIFLLSQNKECVDFGGIYVRTIIWFECINND